MAWKPNDSAAVTMTPAAIEAALNALMAAHSDEGVRYILPGMPEECDVIIDQRVIEGARENVTATPGEWEGRPQVRIGISAKPLPPVGGVVFSLPSREAPASIVIDAGEAGQWVVAHEGPLFTFEQILKMSTHEAHLECASVAKDSRHDASYVLGGAERLKAQGLALLHGGSALSDADLSDLNVDVPDWGLTDEEIRATGKHRIHEAAREQCRALSMYGLATYPPEA